MAFWVCAPNSPKSGMVATSGSVESQSVSESCKREVIETLYSTLTTVSAVVLFLKCLKCLAQNFCEYHHTFMRDTYT